MLAILLRMADDYTSDANYFMENGDYVRAFGAINYAHAWIDAGIKLRLLDGHGDDGHGEGINIDGHHDEETKVTVQLVRRMNPFSTQKPYNFLYAEENGAGKL